MHEDTERMGAEIGIRFDFARARRGNTFDAHRVLHMAQAEGRQAVMIDRLLAAYFSEGEPIGDRDALARVAGAAGLDAAAVGAMLAGEDYAADVRADEREAAGLGISAVPFFVIDRRFGLAGAHPARDAASGDRAGSQHLARARRLVHRHVDRRPDRRPRRRHVVPRPRAGRRRGQRLRRLHLGRGRARRRRRHAALAALSGSRPAAPRPPDLARLPRRAARRAGVRADPDGTPVTRVEGDVAAILDAIGAAGHERVWISGGGDIAGQALAADRIDEVILTVAPTVLGAGPGIFDHPSLPERRFALAECREYGRGSVRLRWLRAANAPPA